MKGKNTPEKTKNVEKAREEQKMGEKTIEKNAITEGVIWKQLLIFFFPIMLGTLIQQLYTTVDTIIVGRFVGKAALASVGGPAAVLSTIVVTFFNGLANGAAVIITILWCKGQKESACGTTYGIFVLYCDQSDRIAGWYSVDTVAAYNYEYTAGYDGRFHNLSQNLFYGNSVHTGLQYGSSNHESGR